MTETWLLESISNAELFDSRYIVHRRDRDYVSTGQSLGGGVLIAVRRDIVAVERPEWRSTAEDIWLTIAVRQNSSTDCYNIHICTLYLCKENQGYCFNYQTSIFFWIN